MKNRIKKWELALLLARVPDLVPCHPSLEQYTTPAEIAADVLFIVLQREGLAGRHVVDLGSGTGRLAIGCALLGASRVVGVEIESRFVYAAREAARSLKASVEFVHGDIACIRGKFDLVVQNPPFGVRRKGADRRFLNKAFSLSNIVYSIHKSDNKIRQFIKQFAAKRGFKSVIVKSYSFPIPYSLPQHVKTVHRVRVDLWRFQYD